MLDQLKELLDPSNVSDWLTTSGLNVTIIILLSVAAYLILTFITRKVAAQIQRIDSEDKSHFDMRVETMRRLVNTTVTVIIIIVAVLTILTELGINIGPLLASVGVASLALGLGAQSLVKDTLSGFFIIVEGQFQVGDVIEVDGRVGTVEDLTLRSTQIRDANGSLHFVPNGEIRVVTNRTRDWSRAFIDVGIAYDDDLSTAEQTLQEIGAMAVADPTIGPLITEEPTVVGIESLEEWKIRLRVMVTTQPNQQLAIQRFYLEQVRRLFPERGLALQYPRQEVVLVQE